ncbi:MAG: DUF3990 domain-containing protein [Planctomycetaceae bacterium]|jgi:hypothetical protein|nr:DUF3990 domain-containing protein [Planctomycetaceae bacterium]
MILFHGSNISFDKVSLDFAKAKRDFGKGFYTTTIKEQATSWAENLCKRYKTQTAYLYTFEFSSTGLTIKMFESLSREWLDFIIANRVNENTQHHFDVVIGAVANDRIMDTISFFLAGIYTVEEALKRLEYMKPNNQVSLHTEKTISNLKLIRKDKWNV